MATNTQNNNQNNSDPVDQFLNQILDEKKITGETPAVRQQLVADLRQRLMDLINRAMINQLSQEQLDKFNQLLDRPDYTEQEVQQFFVDSGIDVQQVTLATMMAFRSYYLGEAK